MGMKYRWQEGDHQLVQWIGGFFAEWCEGGRLQVFIGWYKGRRGGIWRRGSSSWLVARYVTILDPSRIYGYILFIKMCVSLRHSLYLNSFL